MPNYHVFLITDREQEVTSRPTTTPVSTTTTLYPLPPQCQDWYRDWCRNGGTVIFREDIQYCGCTCAPGYTDYYCESKCYRCEEGVVRRRGGRRGEDRERERMGGGGAEGGRRRQGGREQGKGGKRRDEPPLGVIPEQGASPI